MLIIIFLCLSKLQPWIQLGHKCQPKHYLQPNTILIKVLCTNWSHCLYFRDDQIVLQRVNNLRKEARLRNGLCEMQTHLHLALELTHSSTMIHFVAKGRPLPSKADCVSWQTTGVSLLHTFETSLLDYRLLCSGATAHGSCIAPA